MWTSDLYNRKQGQIFSEEPDVTLITPDEIEQRLKSMLEANDQTEWSRKALRRAVQTIEKAVEAAERKQEGKDPCGEAWKADEEHSLQEDNGTAATQSLLLPSTSTPEGVHFEDPEPRAASQDVGVEADSTNEKKSAKWVRVDFKPRRQMEMVFDVDQKTWNPKRLPEPVKPRIYKRDNRFWSYYLLLEFRIVLNLSWSLSNEWFKLAWRLLVLNGSILEFNALDKSHGIEVTVMLFA